MELLRASAKAYGGALAAALAAAVLMTWPLAREANDHVLGAIYHWDAYTNAMIMGARVDAVTGRSALSLYDDYFFAPLPNSIAFNENLFGLSLIFAPLYVVSQNPLLSYNLTLLISLSSSAFFTFLLVRRLTESGYAGVLAGVAFAFSPYVMFELGRIQLVATQWIPLCFLMLHQALERQRWRDVTGFWFAYLLQIGTCLYYAMFLIPLLLLVAAVVLGRRRPERSVYVKFGVVGGASAVVALAMVYPYFAMREAFSLERSLSFASRYDGKLGFFWNVSETNLTLTAMHHRGAWRGAHEEIAFPGFTVLCMLALALGVPIWTAARETGMRKVGAAAGRWLVVAALTAAVSLFSRSMLTGALVLGLAILQQVRSGASLPFSGRRGLYLAVLLLSIVMFLGLSPIEWQGAPVRGLYYYFHTYFPGFNGIRKVSRQAVMTTFVFALLSGFGSAWLFSMLRQPWLRGVVFSVLLGATCFELRCFPHPLRSVWAGATVPDAYRFLASLPRGELVATVPNGTGAHRFSGDAGLALHNYLMLYHKHRSVNGQSSFLPPVSDLVSGALRRLPDDGARRILESVGVRYLLVHAEDLEPDRRDLPQKLAAEPEHYRRVFEEGAQTVFELRAMRAAILADTPALPAGARLVPWSELRAGAHPKPEHAARGVDGNARTFWSASTLQARGQYFEVLLARPRRVVAFELENPGHPSDVPLSFELSVADGSGFRTVAEEPTVRVYREQVYSPKTFVFRVALSSPTWTDRVRLTIAEPVPGKSFVIHEARVFAEP